MYVKLALDNAKKSIKDYLIYFITITLCVSLFYAFTSLSSTDYELITKDSFNFEALKIMLKYSSYIITAILSILVIYVNKYMIRRRQREFATYILLGTEQRSVAYMFFIETLIVGIMAIIFGIFIGTLFSQVVTAIVLSSAKQEITFTFRLYMDTVCITFIFFITMFCIIGLLNIRVLKKIKLINMMNAHKQVEFQFKKSKKTYLVVFTMSMVFYSICGYCTFKLIKSIDEPIELILDKMILEVISLATFILGTYLLFYSIAYIMIYIKNKYINFKYENTNLFLIGSLVSKIKSAPILMATISLTFLGGAISFILTLFLCQWSLGYLDSRVPFDIEIRNEYSYFLSEDTGIKEIEDIPKLDYREVVKYLNDENYGVESSCQVEKYFINKDDFNIRNVNKGPVLAIKLSDFNKLRSMLGYKEINLNDNEFTTQWHGMSNQSEINKYIKENSIINIDEHQLKISSNSYYNDSLGEGIYNFYCNNLVVLPDKLCKNLALADTDFFANVKNESIYKAKELETNYLYDWFSKNNKDLVKKYDSLTDYIIDSRIKVIETNKILNITLAWRILGIYLGTVLLMISLTVLSLQELSDSIEHKDRFSVLKKLGVEDKEINKIIIKQISIYFITPIIIAIAGFIVFIYNFYLIYEPVISSYIGGATFILSIVIALILIICIYLAYFIGTYYTFKRNIYK